MPAPEVVARVRDALKMLKTTDLKDPRLIEVFNMSQQLVDAMQAFFGALDTTVYGEFRYIASYISRTKQEISNLRPNDIKEERIPRAGLELDAIIRHTEEATHNIMTSAEVIMAANPMEPGYGDLVNDKILDIFQACSFQDITGQRIRKVVETLEHIESRITRFVHVMGIEDAAIEETEEDRRRKRLLLNGPQMAGEAKEQDDIDAMFHTQAAKPEPAGPANQDDIDALFG